jgi:demethylmenaquinone methyltransferase/2-methoxy-6-polyprenyl-1,4-benzoquinol methylase
MVPLRDLDLEAHLADPARKPNFVTPMFDIIAPRYDDFTRLFSFGMDRAWKDELLRRALAAAENPATVIDLACGTGDIAIELARLAPEASIVGVDASDQMLVHGNERLRQLELNSVRLTSGDMAAIPAADHSVDLITAGYAFRNGPPLSIGLAEVARVLKPGGILAVLDFYRPPSALWRAAYLAYLRAAGNLFGWWWHREPVVYGYIAASIEAWVSAEQFNESLQAAGFQVIETRSKLLGGVAIHVARLP